MYKSSSNLLFVEYEALKKVIGVNIIIWSSLNINNYKKNPKYEQRRIAEFLEIKNIDEQIIEDVVNKSSFSKMKNNPLIYSNLMRKGIKLNYKHNNVFNIQKKYIL